MRLKYSIIIIISLIIIYPLMGQSFESNVIIVEDFCEGGNGFQPLREYKRHLVVEIFEGWKPPVPFEPLKKVFDKIGELIIFVSM